MATDLNLQVAGIKDDYKYGFRDSDDNYSFKSGKGLTRDDRRPDLGDEERARLDARLPPQGARGLLARSRPRPGAATSRELNFDDIHYYMKAADRQGKTWDDVPAEIKNTFDKLGIPEAERKFLAGVGAQYESEVVYHSLREDLQKKGVIFVDTDTALREYPDLVKQYFGTIIPIQDNKFAALNSAVWSGGSFVYIPAGVKVDIPLQAYFRINAENMGQFERTLIIVEEGAQVHYVEGCTAPMYSTESLHSAVVEIIVKKGGRCRYTTIQNWANNIYNLVTKRAVAHEDALMEWVDGNLGSRLTMKYPAVYMMGKGARGEILSIAFAGKGQHQDAGGKVVHARPLHQLADHLQEHQQERRPGQLPRPAQGRRRCQGLEVERRLRRPDPRPAEPVRHLSLHRDRRGRRQDRPRGQRLQDRRGAALLPDEPRPLRGRGLDPDRQRLHRAARQGAADGVRRRDEQADPAPDGRLGGVSNRAEASSVGSMAARQASSGFARDLGVACVDDRDRSVSKPCMRSKDSECIEHCQYDS